MVKIIMEIDAQADLMNDLKVSSDVEINSLNRPISASDQLENQFGEPKLLDQTQISSPNSIVSESDNTTQSQQPSGFLEYSGQTSLDKVETCNDDDDISTATIFKLNEIQHYTIAENVIVETVDLLDSNIANPTDGETIDLVDSESADVLLSDGSSSDCVIEENPKPQKKTVKRKAAKKEPETLDPMRDWEDVEKRQLLDAVKIMGINDINQIAAAIPSKTLKQVEEASKYFRQLAESHLACTAREFAKRRNKTKTRAPRDGNRLTSWLRELNNTFDDQQLGTVTADALRLIAECEEIPHAEETSNVDFRKLYSMLANTMDSFPTHGMSEECYEIVRRVLTDLAVNLGHLKQHFGQHMQNLHGWNTSLPKSLNAIDKNCPLKVRLANLTSKKAYDPLGIPLTMLDPISMVVPKTEESSQKNTLRK